MDRRYMFAALLSSTLLLCTGCVELPGIEEEDDDVTAQLSKSYTGTLTVIYSVTFPDFTATTSMSVDIAKSGIITVGSAPPASWDADEVKQVDDGQFRQKDSGSMSISHGSSVVIIRGTDEFIALDVHVTLTGEQETFVWDEEKMTWISGAKVPYNLKDPMKPPLEFEISEATEPFNGAVKTHTSSKGLDDTVTYTMKLFLLPGLDQEG